jgi:uncharacterized protein (TIGR03435 family)
MHVAAAGSAAFAQTDHDKPLAFEVASVKLSGPGTSPLRNAPPGSRGFVVTPTTVAVNHATLKSLLRWAYDVEDYQVSGGPGWADTEWYDVDARAGGPSSPDQLRVMMRSLLSDRFQLASHSETKSMLLNVLSVAGDGPKFGSQFHLADTNAGPSPLAKPVIDQLHFSQVSMKTFATFLRLNLSHDLINNRPINPAEISPVLDQTGLSGVYDIVLKTKDQGDWPKVLDRQMGLKLDLRKAPITVIVIDAVSRPSPN